MAVIVVAAGATLVWWERRVENPVLPLSMLTRDELKPLFTLSLVLGFCMFAITFYAPLLFQGGFGLTPHQAGLLVTPLAVAITIGSIINGRIVWRLSSPKIMLYFGLAFFALAAAALTRTTAASSHGFIVAAMAMAGFGLGWLMPNLTLFIQASAPRPQLGVATAMLQSARMIGGMIGMALIGALVSHLYVRDVNNLLATGGHSSTAGLLRDPQILVDPALAERFGQALMRTGENAAALLESARTSLVDAVHDSQWLVALIAIAAVWIVRRAPSIGVHRQAKTPGDHQ
jgi:MFS family permease